MSETEHTVTLVTIMTPNGDPLPSGRYGVSAVIEVSDNGEVEVIMRASEENRIS